MRWTIRVCEAGMARIYEHSVAGRTEQETPQQRTLYAAALEQIEHNLALIRPGMDYRE
jgi:Xaa-Pro aminopeptidase